MEAAAIGRARTHWLPHALLLHKLGPQPRAAYTHHGKTLGPEPRQRRAAATKCIVPLGIYPFCRWTRFLGSI